MRKTEPGAEQTSSGNPIEQAWHKPILRAVTTLQRMHLRCCMSCHKVASEVTQKGVAITLCCGSGYTTYCSSSSLVIPVGTVLPRPSQLAALLSTSSTMATSASTSPNSTSLSTSPTTTPQSQNSDHIAYFIIYSCNTERQISPWSRPPHSDSHCWLYLLSSSWN